MDDSTGRGRGVGRAQLLGLLKQMAKERQNTRDSEDDDELAGAVGPSPTSETSGFEYGRREGVNRQAFSRVMQAEQSYNEGDDEDSLGSLGRHFLRDPRIPKQRQTEQDQMRGRGVRRQNIPKVMEQTGTSYEDDSDASSVITMLKGRGVSRSDRNIVVPQSRAEYFRFLDPDSRRNPDDVPRPDEKNFSSKSSGDDNSSSGYSSQRFQHNKPRNVPLPQQHQHYYKNSSIDSCESSKSFGRRQGLLTGSFDSHTIEEEGSISSEGRSRDSGVEFSKPMESTVSIHDKENKAKSMVRVGYGHPNIQAKPSLDSITDSVKSLSIGDPQNKVYSASETSGTKGIKVDLDCNYIRIEVDPNKGIFSYEVRFAPAVDNVNLRVKILNKFRDLYGGIKTFDGVQLYVPNKLPNDVTTVYDEEFKTEMKLVFMCQKRPKDCAPLYNILFDRVMRTLKYVRHARRQFDPTAPKIIPQAKLEIWPGYVIAADEFKGGLMLCCDVSHRLLSQKTVLEELTEIYTIDPANFQTNAIKSLVGTVALTRYNNKNYRIDDINFKMNPQSTFTTSNGEEIRFETYFKDCYNLTIRDKRQPLLTNIKKVTKLGAPDGKEEQTLYLIPEITYLTGLRDAMRSDFRLMQEISSFTRVTPAQRISAYNKFCQNIERSPEALKILSDWGLRLCSSVEKIVGRNLDEERIIFKNSTQFAGKNCDFTRHISNNEVLSAIQLTNWCIIYHKQNIREFNAFTEHMNRNCHNVGIRVFQPKVIEITDVALHTFVDSIRTNRMNKNLQIIVIIVPNLRDDRYSAIKKVCSIELGVPSQVIHARTLSKDMKNRSIVMKIALQINCKLGGSLWSVNIPFKNVMICGIDTYHDPDNKSSSVSALVASLNSSYTRWFSKANIQTRSQEFSLGLVASLQKALKEYLQENGTLPSNIIVFRDGISDGQLDHCLKIEVPQIDQCIRQCFDNYNPKISFIVVQKRISTRFFKITATGPENPSPGTVVDSNITRFNMYDFFLVSQSVRQGTVSPAHYIVLRDDASYSPDILQRLSYKLTFMYYNWSGTIRVPACCQYAHKLAYLVGQNLKKNASDRLDKFLYYL